MKKLNINIKLQDLNKVNVDLLKNALSSKGDVSLYFTVVDDETGLKLNLLSHNTSIKLTDEIADFLINNENLVTYALNGGQWKPRKKEEVQAVESDDDFEGGNMLDPMESDD